MWHITVVRQVGRRRRDGHKLLKISSTYSAEGSEAWQVGTVGRNNCRDWGMLPNMKLPEGIPGGLLTMTYWGCWPSSWLGDCWLFMRGTRSTPGGFWKAVTPFGGETIRVEGEVCVWGRIVLKFCDTEVVKALLGSEVVVVVWTELGSGDEVAWGPTERMLCLGTTM